MRKYFEFTGETTNRTTGVVLKTTADKFRYAYMQTIIQKNLIKRINLTPAQIEFIERPELIQRLLDETKYISEVLAYYREKYIEEKSKERKEKR